MSKPGATPSGKDKHAFENGSFPEDSVNWIDTPEGKRSIDALDPAFDVLPNVVAKRRKIVWPDGKQRSIEEAAKRLHAEHLDMLCDPIEIHVFGWLEGCAPESHTDQQMEEFDQVMKSWLEHDERMQWADGRWPNIQHSRANKVGVPLRERANL